MFLQVVSLGSKLPIQPSAQRFSRPSSAVGRDRAVIAKANRVRDDLSMLRELNWIIDVLSVFFTVVWGIGEYEFAFFCGRGAACFCTRTP